MGSLATPGIPTTCFMSFETDEVARLVLGMADDEQPRAYHDMAIATLYRMDPEKLKAIRRAMTGMTRCPECDALNRADQKYCDRCGAKLYPELVYEEEREKKKEEAGERKEPVREQHEPGERYEPQTDY